MTMFNKEELIKALGIDVDEVHRQGFVIVPLEPTEEMLQNGIEAGVESQRTKLGCDLFNKPKTINNIYRRMIEDCSNECNHNWVDATK